MRHGCKNLLTNKILKKMPAAIAEVVLERHQEHKRFKNQSLRALGCDCNSLSATATVSVRLQQSQLDCNSLSFGSLRPAAVACVPQQSLHIRGPL